MLLVNSTLLDSRPKIGPHHLGIGKTRKLIWDDDKWLAFYSTGHQIECKTSTGEETTIKPIPSAFGGGAFCDDGKRLVYISPDRHILYEYANGESRQLTTSQDTLAAPWVHGGTWSVLQRRGPVLTNFGSIKDWYHSCVQAFWMDGKPVAVGFKGDFPTDTSLVCRHGDAETIIAKCNVNDHTTFHFQAAQADNGAIYVVFLADKLTVSMASYDGKEWDIVGRVIPVSSFAPQITLDRRGDPIVIAADYCGNVWCGNQIIAGLKAPEISPLFALTGYGTGGMIAPEKLHGTDMPVLIANCVNEQDGEWALTYHTLETEPDTNAMLAKNPARITRTYKRMM